VLFQLTLLLAGVGSIYLLSKELLPHKLSPQTMFSNSFELLRSNAELQKMIGEDMKAFGRVRGGARGVDSRAYTHTDGSERSRIRYHIEGARGKVAVWAEMSDNLVDTDEFVYLICRNQRTGKVLTVHDNRQRLDHMAATAAVNGTNQPGGMKGLLADMSSVFGGSK
jgi:hypothetical protein